MRVKIEDYKTIVHYPVQWGDMDAAQHVNNLIYLRWGESARILYFEKTGIDTTFNRKSIGPILGWQECKYIFPMTYPDTAIVGIRTLEIKEDRVLIETAVFSKKHERIAAISKQSIVPYDYAKLGKAPMPDFWRTGIEKTG